MQISEDFQKQILVVEDEGLIAADIQRRLERLGYPQPAIAGSGEEALRCARSTPFDLVLMDIRLKGDMDGIATAQALKTELETPVVYITAHSDHETIERAKLTEPLGYILKPITDGDLRSVVQISIYRHQMERRVRASEAWLSTTLRSIAEGIIATDPSGEVAFLNPLAEQLTGWTSDEARGRPLMDILGLSEETTGAPAPNPVYDLFPEETRAYVLLSKTGAKTPVEVACRENRAPVSSSSPEQDDEILGAVLVVRDIGARRDLESRLMQSQRMEAITNMAGVLAHEFNNQLMVISGYAAELCASLSGPSREQALEIQQAAAIASSTTGQLLTLSRRDAARFEVVDINQLVCEVQPLISHTLGKCRTLATELASPRGYVRGDRNQLKQVLLNLAINARDAMPAGGEMRIAISSRDVAAEQPAARMYRSGPYVEIRVSDTGEGMDAATLSHIFEPWFTTKKAGFGTGLGLSIVHSIILQSGGYISAQSQPGYGTSFEILLPCVGTFLGTGERPEGERPAREDSAPTVLLVEDEDSIRRLMHKFLAREGYQLLAARNGEEAADLAGAYQWPIQILVTDVVMPGMTGPQLAERLKPLRPEMQVLFVSGYRHHTVEHERLWQEGVNFLPKPFPALELVRRVQQLLRPERLLPQ